MLRRLAAVVALAAALAGGSALPAGGQPRASVCTGSCFAAPAGSGALLVFTGHGWGHGVGMSQYGAYGYAQHGADYRQILAHYYPGTTLGTSSTARIRVLLADRKQRLKLSSDAPLTVTDGAGATHTLAAGAVTLGPALRLAVDGQSAPVALPPPLTFAPTSGSTITLARPYHGWIVVDVVDAKLRAVDVVSLETYLDGVVPAEMPYTWAPEALKAQAVAARSYALATRRAGAPFDVYGDTRSQLYLGASREQPSTTAAVAATKGEVLLFGTQVATTYFSSTSGGQTESSADWLGVPMPYLVSVPDPYDDISPYHDWGPVPVTARAAAKKLAVKGPITDVATTTDAAGRVATIDLTAASTDVPVPAAKARAALGLRSTWFDVGLLGLAVPAPAAPIPYGATVTLTGTIRGLAGVWLEQRTAGGSWQAIGPVAPASGDTLTLAESPSITTDYRLATETAAAAYVRIRVAPVVTIAALGPAGAQGSEQPVLPDAPAQVQQQAPDGSWTTIATGAVDAAGSFDVPAQLASGAVYRVVVAPGHGYSPGTTAAQTVVR